MCRSCELMKYEPQWDYLMLSYESSGGDKFLKNNRLSQHRSEVK